MAWLSLLAIILIVFYGTAYISFSAKETGLFAWISEKSLARHWHGWLLGLTIFVVSGVLCFLTDNDVVILTMTPILLHLHGTHDIRKLLLIQFAGANTFSVFSLVSNPTNVIIASRFNIDYIKFIEIMWPIGIIVAVAVFTIGPKFKESIVLKPPHKTRTSENLIFSGIGVSCLLILLTTSRYTGLEIWACVLIILALFIFRDMLCKSLAHNLKQLPVRAGLIITSGLIAAEALSYFGFTESMATTLSNQGFIVAALAIAIISPLVAALIVNIPMAILFSSILLYTDFPHEQKIALISLVFLSSDISTLIFRRASLAGHMWQHMIEQDDGRNISRGYFAKYLAPAGISAMLIGLIFVVLQS